MDVLQLLNDHLGAILVFLAAFIGHVVLGAREERKEKKERRAAAIARWRADVSELRLGVGSEFQDSTTYSEIKGFLPADLREKIEQPRGTFTVVLEAGTPAEGESLKGKLLKEITRIEREEWKLL